MRHKTSRTVIVALLSAVGAVLITVLSAFTVLHLRTASIDDDFSEVFTNEKYRTPVSVGNVNVITQEVSCGYAVLEMFSAWSGGDITEESLYNEYGRVVTSTGRSFADEMNRQFPQYDTEIRRYLTNTELIDLVYDQLSKGIPVPFEWAAPHSGEWTLHYSLVTGMDIEGDSITVANPYGYVEEVHVDDFLKRTRFDAYENMPLFLKLGFAFGIFEKNTVFTVSERIG